MRLSEDGLWVWDGQRWSAANASVSGSILLRAIAWSILAGLPLGCIAAAFIGPALANINTTLGIVAAIVIIGAIETGAMYLLVRTTPRITVENGTMRVGTVGGTKFEREIPVSQVTAVEIKRGNRELMYVTEGAAGEGHVFIRLQPHQVPVELGWDAFSDKANRLAWMLGVPLVLPATKADGGGAPVQTTAN